MFCLVRGVAVLYLGADVVAPRVSLPGNADAQAILLADFGRCPTGAAAAKPSSPSAEVIAGW